MITKQFDGNKSKRTVIVWNNGLSVLLCLLIINVTGNALVFTEHCLSILLINNQFF